ncbi:DegV family protein, partial [mine drainage metagenome]
MRIGLVVDSACDLPADFLRAHAITLLPISVRSDLISFEDRRDPAATLRFFREQLGDRAHH